MMVITPLETKASFRPGSHGGHRIYTPDIFHRPLLVRIRWVEPDTLVSEPHHGQSAPRV